MTSTTKDTPRRDPACAACSKAKRRCGRQLPSCRRCRVQGLRCTYPFKMTETRVMLPDTPESSSTRSASVTRPPSPGLGGHVGLAGHVDHVTAPWFLEPSSWDIDHVRIGEDDRITYPDSGLDYFIDRLRAWLDQWTSENRCPFAHARLYGADMPASLQHAFAAWRFYRGAANPTSRRMALRMAADWSQNLAQDVLMSESLGGLGVGVGVGVGVGETTTPPPPSLVEQLGRTQAMLIFQVIGLFDGDVRARAGSELLLSTVTRWADSLLRTAGAASVVSDRPHHHHHPPDGQPPNSQQISQLCSDGTAASAWKAWLLSESVRRLWIVATLTEAAFLIWQQGNALCPGSIAFTGRSGLWDATTPASWLARMRESSPVRDPVFCRGLDRLLTEARPSDVDEFTHALLAYGRGREAVEDWVASG